MVKLFSVLMLLMHIRLVSNVQWNLHMILVRAWKCQPQFDSCQVTDGVRKGIQPDFCIAAVRKVARCGFAHQGREVVPDISSATSDRVQAFNFASVFNFCFTVLCLLKRHRNSAADTIEENSSVFYLTKMCWLPSARACHQ